MRSIPNYFEFDPTLIPTQHTMLDMIDEWDYSQGLLEILLSGSIGSAKSLPCAHAAVRHCVENDGARFIIGRQALPDIKATQFEMIVEHLSCDGFIEGKDYWLRTVNATVTFRNGSKIIPYYWADKKYKRIRSVNASAGWIEEMTESQTFDAFMELKGRLGRLPHIKEKFLLGSTNPDSPAHWVHKYYIDGSRDILTRQVLYSRTKDNPFLDPIYIKQLEQDYDPKMARRMIYGEWVEINTERIYHQYETERNFRDREYEIDKKLPINIHFDFNIGHGKPMSSCVSQYENSPLIDTWHTFDEVIIEGIRTADVMDEWFEKGYLTMGQKIIIYGDASGSHNDTRNLKSDYDIIRDYLKKIPGCEFEIRIPKDNPPIKMRHNIMNGYCFNEAKKTRLFVYKKCKVTHDGMRLTALKPKADYIEDDSKPFQHVTTALGYGVLYEHRAKRVVPGSSQRR